jgi:hypothetical protein
MVRTEAYSLLEWHCDLVLVLPRISAHRQTLFTAFEYQFLSPFFVGIVTPLVAISGLNGAENVLIMLYIDFECIPLLKGCCYASEMSIRNLSLRNLAFLGQIFGINSMVCVRERTIPTERPPLVEVIANFCG